MTDEETIQKISNIIGIELAADVATYGAAEAVYKSFFEDIKLASRLREFLSDCGYDSNDEPADKIWTYFEEYLDNNLDGG